ncbi:MAG: hypothetical protein U0031_06070 [Thermomicrobiales bacterium]
MDDVSFDGLARRAARTFDRKTALTMLGGMAALAAIPGDDAEAKSSGKNAKKRCQQQKPECLAFVKDRICNRTEVATEAVAAPDTECIAFYSPCCDAFAQCLAGEGFACLLRRQPVAEPA